MITAALVTATIVLATLADLYTTKRAVTDNPTLYREGNPLVAKIIVRFGILGFAVVKLCGIAVLLGLVWYFQSWAAYGPILVGAAGVGWVAWHNKRLISKTKK